MIQLMDDQFKVEQVYEGVMKDLPQEVCLFLYDKKLLITDKGIKLGLVSYKVEDKIVTYAIHLITGEHHEFEVVSLVDEYMFRRGMEELRVLKEGMDPQLFLMHGYEEIGEYYFKHKEYWRNFLPGRAFDQQGYLINQGLLKDIPYGSYNSADKGCGWISVYNLLKGLNTVVNPQEIREHLSSRAFIKGLLGTRIREIVKLLRLKGYPARAILGGRRRLLKYKGERGILLYFHQRGAHYVAYKRLDESLYIFYNAVYGRENDIMSMDDFMAQHFVFPYNFVIVLKGGSE